jgi:nicotinic acid phosphoribosyltransferase
MRYHAVFQFLTSFSEENAVSFFYPEDGSSETLVTTYQTTLHHALKDIKNYFSRSS